MPTLTILGRKVKVGDEFLALSDEDKQKTVDEIAAGMEDEPSGLEKFVTTAAKPITSYPEAYSELVGQSVGEMKSGASRLASIVPSDRPRVGPFPDEPATKLIAGTVESGLGALGYATAPVNAAIRTLVGDPVQKGTGIPREYTEFAAGMMLGRPIPGRQPRQPLPPPLPAQMGGVTLSEGQLTRDLPQIQFEQAAVRGQSGAPAQRAAQAFMDQQQGQVAAARGNIVNALDPITGQPIVESAREAGAVTQQALQAAAQRAQAGVRGRYQTAQGLGGEIHAGAFEGMPQRIKGDLTLGTEPVFIDEALTPFANRMIKDLDANVGRLRIPNAADPFGAPAAANITGVSLQGVEQWRKRLSSMRRDAYASGNAADGRAAQRVINAFDDQIDQAVNGGLFSGDPRAVRAWNDARAAHADYRATFGGGGARDPVGKVIEKIVGRADRPEAIPNDVADFIFGTTGINPNSLNVAVVNRLQGIFGAGSQEWTAIKQGLFQRLVDAGEGVTAMGPQKVADRINKFLNGDGREMAQSLFTGAERRLIQEHADMLRHLQVPQAGANWSNTATFAAQGFRPSMGMRAVEEIGHMIAAMIGGPLGHIPGVGGLIRRGVESVAGMPTQARDAARVAQQMPVIANVLRQHARAQRTWELSPNTRNAIRVSTASRALTEALNQIGVTLPPDFAEPAQQ